MAKKIDGYIKLQIPAGGANPAPPVGPALGQKGVNIMDFCKQFNAKTQDQPGMIIPVVITVYADRSFSFICKTPPAAVLIKKAAGLDKASGEPNNAVMALETTGTPADCVKLGLKVLGDIGIEIDMVFSGINLGGNMGTDTLYSGTVAAAIEGSVCGKPSVAVSVNSHNAAHFEYACRLAARCAQNACGRLEPGTVLNINVPDLPDAEIKGTRITTLGKRNYEPWFVLESGQEHDADNIDLCYRYGGNPINYDMDDKNADVAAVAEGYASITPLMHNLTARDMVEEIKKWRLI